MLVEESVANQTKAPGRIITIHGYPYDLRGFQHDRQ